MVSVSVSTLALLFLTTSMAQVPPHPDTPAWSPACYNKNTGPKAPQLTMETSKTFLSTVVKQCGNAPPGCLISCDVTTYVQCYNSIVYRQCANITDAVPCTFTVNGTTAQLAVCYAKECNNNKDLQGSSKWLEQLEKYPTTINGECGSGMGAGGVFGVVVLILVISSGAGAGIWWWRKKQDSGGYMTHV
jgi:hypothetical protein